MLEVFDAVRSRRGEPGHDDRRFLEALHFFTVHNVTWRALPAEYGAWNSVWKRFWRLGRVRGVLPGARRSQPNRAPGADVRQHGGAGARLGSRSKGGSRAKRSEGRGDRIACRERGIVPVIPHRFNAEHRPAFFPRVLYKGRARIEAVAKLKRFKRVALRCEKTAESYAAVAFAYSMILVKSVHTA